MKRKEKVAAVRHKQGETKEDPITTGQSEEGRQEKGKKEPLFIPLVFVPSTGGGTSHPLSHLILLYDSDH